MTSDALLGSLRRAHAPAARIGRDRVHSVHPSFPVIQTITRRAEPSSDETNSERVLDFDVVRAKSLNVLAGAGGLEPPNGGIKIHLVRIIHQQAFRKIAAIRLQWVQEVSGYFGMPRWMSAHLGTRRPALLWAAATEHLAWPKTTHSRLLPAQLRPLETCYGLLEKEVRLLAFVLGRP
jgi:hypothetical protein